MIVHEASDLRQLYDTLGNRLLEQRPGDLDFDGARRISFGNVLVADSCHFEFNLTLDGTGMLSRQRWTRLINDYIDRDTYAVWLEGLPHKAKLGSTPNRTHYYQFKETIHPRHWRGRDPREPQESGGCLLSMAFAHQATPRLILASRSSNWQMIGLDLCVMHAVARDIQAVHGIPLDSIHFTWSILTLSMTPVMTLPWVIVSGNIRRLKEDDSAFAKTVLGFFRRIKDERLQFKWARAARTRRWYNRLRDGTAKSVPLETLVILPPERIEEVRQCVSSGASAKRSTKSRGTLPS